MAKNRRTVSLYLGMGRRRLAVRSHVPRSLDRATIRRAMVERREALRTARHMARVGRFAMAAMWLERAAKVLPVFPKTLETLKQTEFFIFSQDGYARA